MHCRELHPSPGNLFGTVKALASLFASIDVFARVWSDLIVPNHYENSVAAKLAIPPLDCYIHTVWGRAIGVLTYWITTSVSPFLNLQHCSEPLNSPRTSHPIVLSFSIGH